MSTLLEGLVLQMQERVNDFSNTAVALERELHRLQGDVTSCRSEVDTLRQNIDSVKDDMTAVEKQMAGILGRWQERDAERGGTSVNVDASTNIDGDVNADGDMSIDGDINK